MVEKKETVGKVSLDLSKNSHENSHSAHEQMQECLTEWETELIKCAQEHKSKWNTDFFVVVITKKERLMDNVLRNYFFARLTCPTPDYDQTVYRIDRKLDIIDFVWTIPSKDTCLFIKENILAMAPEERQLTQYVLDFADGTLFRIAKKFNNEQDDSVFLEK